MRFPKVAIAALAAVAFGVFTPGAAQANNLNVSNFHTASHSSTSDTVTFQFDISWDNAWRDSVNYDAAWIFVKYSTDSGSTWSHATLKTAGVNPSGFSTGSGTAIEIVVSNDKKGCFIERSAQGSGSVSTTSVQIVWDYAVDGVSDANAQGTSTVFKIYGIEMVYVPQGSFYLGDGSTGTNGEIEFGGATGGPVGSVGSEGGMSFGTGASQWYYNAPAPANTGENADGDVFEVGASFPKGYAAFYLMKHEITEGQWVEFFNTLTSAQKTNRDITSLDATQSGKNSDSTVDRNTISWTSGDASTSRTDRAIGYLSWQDVCAFADWAALRPMTELEFEKACRGPVSAVDGEYAWGTTSATVGATISGTEDGTETITTASANVNHGNTTFTGGDASAGPLRAGIFSTSSTTTRATSGGGYYGNMDLSGSLWEHVVTIGNATGRGFAGTHGDGVLTTLSTYEGNATNSDWPGLDSTNTRGVTGATGSGLRGSGWNQTTAAQMEISNRPNAAKTDVTRVKDYGGRCARTA